MTLFDLLFLLTASATVVLLVVAGVLAIAGRRTASWRVLRGLVISAAAYLVVGLAVSLLEPQRVYAVGEPWCFDDWCLTVEGVTPSTAGAGGSYEVDLLLSSRARRISQRARGAWIYLIDGHGHRYAPEAQGSPVPLDTLLGPGESISASRRFHVPEGIRPVGLVTGHGGPYCGPMSVLVIGAGGCLFHKPAMVRMP